MREISALAIFKKLGSDAGISIIPRGAKVIQILTIRDEIWIREAATATNPRR